MATLCLLAGQCQFRFFLNTNILPPACVLIEGYGNVKTEAYTIVQPSGGKFKAKQNGFNAFRNFYASVLKILWTGHRWILGKRFYWGNYTSIHQRIPFNPSNQTN